MADKYEEIADLVIAYITRQLSEDQERTLHAWVEESPANKAWLEQWNDMGWIANELEEYNKPDVDEALSEFWTSIDEGPSGAQLQPVAESKTKLQRVWKYVAAAAVILLLIGSYNLLRNKRSPLAITDTSKTQADSVKKENIILSSTVQPALIFDSLPNGLITNQAGVAIAKGEGILHYTTVGQDATALNVIQTVSTGKGKQLQVILPDSSSVWLNAVSSIRFPLAYTTERWIEMNGEVFVDVHKNKKKPFRVIADKWKVVALGTKFNVNTYDTTKKVALLEGKIKIESENVNTTLSVPGQIALLGKYEKIKINPAGDSKDIEKVTAWRSGEFTFRKDPITDALREMERWYGVEIRYLNTPPTVITHTSFPRNIPLTQAVDLLKQVDTSLTILKQGNVLIVSYNKK